MVLRSESVRNRAAEKDHGMSTRILKAAGAISLTAAGVAYGGAGVGVAQSEVVAAVRAPHNVDVIVNNSAAHFSDVVSGSVTFLADEHIDGYKSRAVLAHCLTEKTFWNSGRGANGKIYYFLDHNGKLCRDTYSPTGWVKVAGGVTGRDCGNAARPYGPIPGPKAPGKVEMLTSLNTLAIIRAQARETAKAGCHTASGYAEASAWSYGDAQVKVNLNAFLRESQQKQLQTGINVTGHAQLNAKAFASAEAKAECVPIVPATTTTSTTTTTTPIPPPSFKWKALPPAQEADTAGGVYEDCGVAMAPNNDQISVDIESNSPIASVVPEYPSSTSEYPVTGTAGLYCADVFVSQNAQYDPLTIYAEVTDTVTGKQSAVALDSVNTQPMPSLGS